MMREKSFLQRLWKDLLRNKGLYIMILPIIAYYLIFHYYPMYGAQIAFRDYKPIKGIIDSKWVGLKHFKAFFDSVYAVRLIRNTLMINFKNLLFGFPAPIILALLLNEVKNMRFKKLIQTVSYLPHFISTVIIVSMINMIFDNRSGVLDRLLEFISGGEVNVLGNPENFRALYVWSGIWQNLGWSSILFVSALAGVDPTLHEAAMIDGANKWQRVWHVDIMSIIPTISITFIMNFGRILSVGFDKAFLMQNATNLKYSMILSVYEYKSGIGGAIPQYSYSAAIGLMLSLVTFILIMVVNKISKKLTETGLW